MAHVVFVPVSAGFSPNVTPDVDPDYDVESDVGLAGFLCV